MLNGSPNAVRAALNHRFAPRSSTLARDKIRSWFRHEGGEENIARGRKIVETELHRLGTSIADIQDELLQLSKDDNLDDLLIRVGRGEVSTGEVATMASSVHQPDEEGTVGTLDSPPDPTHTVNVRGLAAGEVSIRLAACCNPVPEDEIVGYVTRGRGITVHRRDCADVLKSTEKERLVEVGWGSHERPRRATVRIDALDRVGLLREISATTVEERVAMVGVSTQEEDEGRIGISLTLEASSPTQMMELVDKLRQIRGVNNIEIVDKLTRTKSVMNIKLRADPPEST